MFVAEKNRVTAPIVFGTRIASCERTDSKNGVSELKSVQNPPRQATSVKFAQHQPWRRSLADRPARSIHCSRSVLIFELVYVIHQFGIVGPAGEVPAKHSIGAQRRLAAGP